MLLWVSLKIGHLKISWLTMPPRASVAVCVGVRALAFSLHLEQVAWGRFRLVVFNAFFVSQCFSYIYIYNIYICIPTFVYIYVYMYIYICVYILYYIVCIHPLLASLSCYGNRIMQLVVAVRSMARAMTRSPGPSMRRWNTSGGLFQRLWNSSGNMWEYHWVE